MSGAEIGPNDIIIHLVNPFKCLDCGTEFFHKNSFLQHLAEHMDKLKSQHPCYQIVCGVNLAAQQPNSITVTKDILQINENQMFELQNTSVDYTQLPPLKTLEQAGILHLPAPEKVIPPSVPKLHNSQPFGINITSQSLLQQGITQQNVALVQGQTSSDNLRIVGKPCDEKQLDSNIVLNNLQNLQAAGTTPVELHTFVQQALINDSGIKEELNLNATSTQLMGKGDNSSHFDVLSKMGVTKGSEPWTNVNEQPLTGVKHVMVFKEMPDTVMDMTDKRVECKICFNRFANKNVLMRHQVVHTGDKPHCCHKCFKQFNDLSSLAKHIKIHKRSHQCPVCLKMFLNRRQMELHLSQHKKRRFIQFGHKYHEVQVSTSRNDCGQVVHEFSLSVLIKKDASQNEPNKDIQQENVAQSKNATNEDKPNANEDTTSVSNVLNRGQELNDVQQSVVAPENSENITVSNNDKEIDNSQTENKEHNSPNTNTNMYKVIYRCGHCKKYINTRPTLSRHLMLHTNEKPFKCEQCGKQFRHKSDLVHHYKTHSKPVKCLTCGSAYSKELYLQNHLQRGCPFLESDNEKFVVLPDSTYQCNLCSKVLKTKANVVRHLRVHAFNDKEKDFKKISRNINQNIDDGKDGNSVDMTSENARDYIKPLESSVGFACSLCGEEFRFKSFILIHVRMHLGQRLFKCNECDKGFYGRYMLRKHQQNHTRPYKCPKCGKGFNRRYLMTHHFNKSHNDEAEDKMKDITFLKDDNLLHCDICGKTMKSYQKSLMQYHIRLHKDVRPHQCKVCQKSFISDIALKKHSLNHSKPYMCQICSKGFSRRYLMLEHFEKSCKYKLNKQEKESMQDERIEAEVDLVQGGDAGTSQAVVFELNEIDLKTHEEPYQAEIVTEIDEVTGKEIFRCVPCYKTFTARDALSRHMKTFMKTTPCKYCSTTFEDKHLTLTHQRSCLGVEVNMKTQSRTLQPMGEKQEKVQRTMKEMNSKIDFLTAALSTEISSTQQIDDVIQMDLGLQASLPDNISTTTPVNQQSNDIQAVTQKTIAIMKENSAYQCPNCTKCFGTPRGLKIHAASHVRLYKCETCGQDFTQVGKFRLHLKSHDNDMDSNELTNDQEAAQEQVEKVRESSPKKMKSPIRNETVIKKIDLDDNKTDTDNNENMRSRDSHCEVLVEESSKNLKTENVSMPLMQSGTRGRPHSCHLCRKRFTEQSSLHFHLSRDHGVN